MVAIVDYDAGNIKSVEGVTIFWEHPVITRDVKEIKSRPCNCAGWCV